jgi:hypothetical protein
MKRALVLPLILSLAISFIGCNEKKPVSIANTSSTKPSAESTSAVAAPTAASTNKESEPTSSLPAESSLLSDEPDASQELLNYKITHKLVKKQNKARYLLTNGIKINYIESYSVIKTNNGTITLSCPQISGLKDKSLEQTINLNIKSDIEREAKRYIPDAGTEQMFIECRVVLNANNLLCISISEAMSEIFTPPAYSFLYRLTDGKRLSLSDIFTAGTDYVSLLNKKVVEGILISDMSEEAMLKAPFETIKPNQNFSLTPSDLYIVFRKGEGNFQERISIQVPLSSIDDYVDVLDKYTGSERATQLETTKFVNTNNIFITQKGEIYKKPNGNLWLYYPEISGLQDKEFQKTINAQIQKSVNELKNNNILDNLKKPEEAYKDCIAEIHLNACFNNYGILSITRRVNVFSSDLSFERYFKVYSFDLINKKVFDVKTLLLKYIDSNKEAEAKFVNLVTRNIKNACVSRNITIPGMPANYNIDYSYIKKNHSFYIAYWGEGEFIIYDYFNGVTRDGLTIPLVYDILFKDIVKGSHESFFKY